MKLDAVIFAIEPRSVGGCIDLAVVFVREHLLSIFKLLIWFALPSVVLTWWLIAQQEWTLSGCLLLFAIESPFFSAALVGAAGQRVFGERFSARKGIWLLWKRLFFYTFLILVLKTITFFAFFLLIIPAYLIATRYGFLAEVLFLEGCPARKYETRLTDLTSHKFIGLVGRLTTIMLFFSLSLTALFILIDLTSGTLFGYPILIGRMSGLEHFQEEMFVLLNHDPRVATVLVSLMWLIYPVTRLAWMFCYLDVRIRREGWDIELDFRVEAKRIEATA